MYYSSIIEDTFEEIITEETTKTEVMAEVIIITIITIITIIIIIIEPRSLL